MFERLFKSKRQRELERDVAIQRALGLHRQHANKLQQHEQQYKDKARRAQRSGDAVNFQRLCRMAAQTINERRAIESQLLYFETILQTRDKVRLFKDFASGMKAMAKSIRDVFREIDAGDVLKDVESALAQSSQLETTMGLVLDRISASGMTAPAGTGGITAEEVERQLRGEESSAESKLDRQIEDGLKAIERELP